ncbi:MAG TPA: FG-GAP and VCBS repeat-containing protein [Actinoallomurus sp.]|nr:FG-GAP and VCBS repeat-containing protein [Actinoallomurus sp.]
MPSRAAAPPARQAVKGDVTGDGRADIIVAAKGNPTLYVIPGGDGRPAIIDWSRGLPSGTDPITELAAADFNGDGHADIAIGSPRADTHGRPNTLTGRVTLLYGTAAPPYLQTNRAVIFDQDHPSLMHPGDTRERRGGRFGAALATGDFNGDRYPDLAVAAPSSPGALTGPPPRDPNAKKGALVVLYGGTAGLSSHGAQLLVPGQGGVPAGRIGDLAAADITGDGNDDLVIGDSSTTRPGDPKPLRCVDPEGDTAGEARPVGMLHVLRGSAEGLTARNASSISGLDVGIEDDFAHYLAADHFHPGPYADVVVYGGTRRDGHCDEHVLLDLRGGPNGLDTHHVSTTSRPLPVFTCCGGLVSGDLDRDGDADLIVPASPYGGTTLAWLFPAGPDGLFGRGIPLSTGSLGVPPTGWETIETALLDTAGDGRLKLVAGVTYTVDRGERTRLVTAGLSADGPAHPTDLTGTLKDLAGQGPGGEFIR